MAGELTHAAGAGAFTHARRGDWTGPPLTAPQRDVLTALVRLSPEAGDDACARAVAQEAGLRPGGAVLVLRSLAKKRLVIWHRPDAEADEAEAWAPTMTGRVRVRRPA